MIPGSAARDPGEQAAGLQRPRDSGPRDNGSRDNGSRDNGPCDSGPRNSGPCDSGPVHATSGPHTAGQVQQRPTQRANPGRRAHAADGAPLCH